MRGPFLAQHPPKEVLRLLERGFRHALTRQPGTVSVRIEESTARGARLISSMDDQPFIIDTLRLFLRRGDSDYWSGFSVIFRAGRDAEGTLTSVGDDEAPLESLVFLEGSAGTLLRDPEASTTALHQVLSVAQAAVKDFRPMTRSVERFIERCEVRADRFPDRAEGYRETAGFLKWLLRDNFVFMGAEIAGEALGMQTVEGPFYGTNDGSWPVPHDPGTVLVRKSACESPIHRTGRIDEVLIRLDPDDGPDESLFVRGLFTYRAVTQPSRHVPVLRNVIRAELAAQQAQPGSFRYKGVANVFDSLPTEFLFTTPPDALSSMIDLVLDSEQQQEVGVTVMAKEDGSAFCLISMPKAQYSDELRRDIQEAVVDGLGATYSDHGLFVGRFDTVLLHYYLTGITAGSPDEVQALTERVRAMATPWSSRLWQAVAKVHGDERADYLVETYGRAFPGGWVRKTTVEAAMADIIALDSLSGSTVRAAVVADNGHVALRVYQAQNVFLTELLPVLDNFGLTVISSEAVAVESRGAPLSFDSFVLSLDEEQRLQLDDHAELLSSAIPAVLDKRIDNDPLNSLVLRAGLSWNEVDVLRGYLHYMRQLQVAMTTQRMRSIMAAHPLTCRALYRLFEAKFSPDFEGDRDARVKEICEEVDYLLRVLRTHDEDLVLGSIYNLVLATVRTNAFRDDRPTHYISFKFEAARVRQMRGQRPLFEIYVHSRDVEGVHLRFGRVARGGLRWSDRTDFRTEVLGLVTTQQVKNVVIVPEGSKGGFYLPYPEDDRQARREQADPLYKTFIRGLLDVTDNVVEGAIVPPARVVRHDADDPYLVVAADKGTAHLSDTANGISEAYGFWLGDAFASGGSNGYDHKGVGITARGAWVLVRRHFAEMGKNPYAETFSAVGVGDMGGDVFGNGLIETPHCKLHAAFNHLHVFLDPDPDPAASFAERKRLFEVAGRKAGWNHYDPKLISEGGGVYDRSARAIPLSPQAQAMLGIEASEAAPDEVIRAILRMDVDLFWSGGIGTYVKASHQSHLDADDLSNDRSRVDASQLRCKVVGEGANLSFTQAARIEAAHNGVRLNTDFIDNSAGVDMSDHEVNLKILLNAPLGRGDLDADARNALLHSMTEEVAGLVLANNDAQGRQLSRDRIRSQEDIFPFGRAIAFIERVFQTSRDVWQLPSDEVLAERAAAGLGLTRPELSTLSSHVKRWVFSELMASGRARELQGYRDFLVGYFPRVIQERYLSDIFEHHLGDEIAMTMATTRVVGDAGAAFLPMMAESTGRTVFEVVDAYLRSQHLAGAYAVRATLEELRTTVGLGELYRAWVRVDAGCREVTSFWMSSGQRPPTPIELEEMIEAKDEVYRLQADEVARENADLVARMRDADIPPEVSELVLKAQFLNIGLMVWSHAKKLDLSFSDTVVRQLAIGRASRLQPIIDQLGTRATEGKWEPLAGHIVRTRYTNLLRELVLKVGGAVSGETVDTLEPTLREGMLSNVREQVDSVLSSDDDVELAALVVLEERLSESIRRIHV